MLSNITMALEHYHTIRKNMVAIIYDVSSHFLKEKESISPGFMSMLLYMIEYDQLLLENTENDRLRTISTLFEQTIKDYEEEQDDEEEEQDDEEKEQQK